ncbi:MAG: hypothetical protein ACRC8S_11450 [Fimbriiglobus sp.]
MFEYTWFDPALDKLADIFVTLTVAQQDTLTAGIERFHGSISRDPFDVGESRSGLTRIAFPPGLQVLFRVDISQRRVWVIDVIRYGV